MEARTAAVRRGWQSTAAVARRAPALTGREALVFVALAAWVTVGVFLDGFAHSELTTPESFFTPWHGLLYSGVLATNLWLGSRVARNRQRGFSGLAAIPAHWELSYAGAALFPLAGLSDLVWHEAFGVEVGIAQLLSPAHLFLLTSGLLMFSGPVRAGLKARDRSSRPSFASSFPVLLACTLITAIATFFLQFLSPFNDTVGTIPAPTGDVFDGARFDAAVTGIASVLVTTIMLLCPLLALLRNRCLPVGGATFLVTTTVLLMTASEAFADGVPKLAAALAGGVATDLVTWRHGSSRAGFYAAAAALPLATWLTYFIGLEIAGRLAWHSELWGGTVFLAVLSGHALSLVAVPAERPLRASAHD